MGQARMPGTLPKLGISSEEVSRMVCILIRKYGEEAPRVARLMADEHRRGGDDRRAAAWDKVGERLRLLMARTVPGPHEALH